MSRVRPRRRDGGSGNEDEVEGESLGVLGGHGGGGGMVGKN